MSEHTTPSFPTGDPVTHEMGLEALKSSPEFHSPVEPLDDHGHARENDHFALIYESQEEQFAAAIPFLHQGLERGERCLYITYENSREEVEAAMRDCGIDVDAALDSGQLSIHDEEETYLRNEAFDADETIEFIDAAIEEASEEYEALRMTGEMSSVLQEDPDGEELVRCEAKANYLFDRVDGLALCQYNRNRFPEDVIHDVISTHPILVHDGRVSHNVYYTPPEEFFGPDKTEREVDRLLGSLREQTDAKVELHHRERFLRESYRITSDPGLDFEEKLHRLLNLVRERMDLDAAGLTHLPEWDGAFHIEYALGYGDNDGDEVVNAADNLWTDPSDGCFCRQVITADEPVGKIDVRGTNWENDPIYREHGLACYLGTKVTSGTTPYGTLWVGSTEPRNREFSETERTFLELVGQWVSNELERREHNDAQRVLYEIAADPDRSFEEKLDALFELGCEQFGLELGVMATVDPDADRFEVEYVSDDHPHFEPGLELPLSETYCTAATDTDGVVSVDDPVEAGYDDIYVHDEFGIKTYLGTYIEVEDGHDRTFFFGAENSHHGPFSDAERTFQQLLGQWIKYELECRQRERELRERTEHLSALIEATPECIKTVAEDGTLLQMNPAGLEIVEAPAESAVIGENVYDLIAPEHRDRFREFNERICRGERGTLEFDIIGLEGARCHMETHAAPLERPDGETVHVALTRDITEQKEREQELDETITELQESEERLQLALEAGEMGTWELDLRTGEAPVRSPQHDRIFGYEEPVDDWSFETFLDHVHPDDRERVEQHFEEALETDKWKFKCWITGANGEQRAISAQGEFYHDSEGEPVRAVGVVQDITERKQAEEKLQKSKERFRALVTASSDVVYRMSPGWNEMHELEGKDFLSDTDESTRDWVDKYIHPDDRQRVMDAIDEAIRTESVFELEHRVEQNDGTIGWTHSRAIPMLDENGEIDEWIGMASDITERIKRERALRESKNQLRALIDVLPVAVFVAEDDGEIVEWNEAAEDIWGGEIAESESIAEYEAYDGWWADTGEPLEPEEWALARALRGREVTDPDVVEIEGFDEKRRTVLNHGMPVRDADGEVTRAVVTLTDVTEREERKQRLQEQNERLESFASMLAHELRNPVTIGQIYSQQLPEHTDTEAVDYVTEAFERIEDMIDIMLVLTRGREAVDERTPVKLAEVTREAWADVDASEAVFDVATDRIIQADETYTRHLFRNLFENSVEHGGADVTVTVGDLPEGDGFYVADDGPGIPAEDRNRVFDEGFTTAGDNGGTGLGLAFVRKLAEVYEWDLAVTESESGGARFEFRNVT